MRKMPPLVQYIRIIRIIHHLASYLYQLFPSFPIHISSGFGKFSANDLAAMQPTQSLFRFVPVSREATWCTTCPQCWHAAAPGILLQIACCEALDSGSPAQYEALLRFSPADILTVNSVSAWNAVATRLTWLPSTELQPERSLTHSDKMQTSTSQRRPPAYWQFGFGSFTAKILARHKLPRH